MIDRWLFLSTKTHGQEGADPGYPPREDARGFEGKNLKGRASQPGKDFIVVEIRSQRKLERVFPA